MKRTLIAALLVLGITGCSDGLNTTPSTNQLVAPDAYYEIDTWGSNSEVYEFTLRSIPNKQCVYVLTDAKSRPVMQCFDKQL